MLQRGALLSVGIIAANKAVAAVHVTPELLESTVSLCRRQISLDEGTPATSSVQGLANQGVELMSYSTVIKPFLLAAVALVLVTLPFALLGQISDEPPVDLRPSVVNEPTDGAESETPVVQTARTDAPDQSENKENTTAGVQDEAAREETRIGAVTTELLETLRQLVRVCEQQFEVGVVGLNTVIDARRKLFEAQLGLARSRPERLRILEARVRSFRELEQAVTQQHVAGQRSTSQLLAAKAERLEAELTLLRTQATGPATSQSSGPEPETRTLTSIFGNQQAIETVRNAASANAYRLASPSEHRDSLSDFEIVSGPVPVSDSGSKALRKVLLNPATYGWGFTKSCLPDYGVRLEFQHDSDKVDVLLCFDCDVLAVYHNGKAVGGEDFDTGRSAILSIVKELFPDDGAIQSLK
jgi:hypothetical protein